MSLQKESISFLNGQRAKGQQRLMPMRGIATQGDRPPKRCVLQTEGPSRCPDSNVGKSSGIDFPTGNVKRRVQGLGGPTICVSGFSPSYFAASPDLRKSRLCSRCFFRTKYQYLKEKLTS